MRCGAVVYQVVNTTNGIQTSLKTIAEIIGVIGVITLPTNILALNDSVEAARAGEQGRGFALVASKVRSLAPRSATAPNEIKALIGSSGDRVDAGSRLMTEAGATMAEIVASMQQVSQIIGEISTASGEQSQGIGLVNGLVNGSVSQLEQMTQQNAALVEESTAAAESLRKPARKLSAVLLSFKPKPKTAPLQQASQA